MSAVCGQFIKKTACSAVKKHDQAAGPYNIGKGDIFMTTVTLGKTGITVNKNGFGALPIQRITKEEAAKLLRKAYDGGITYFDTARAYSDSEEKIGYALSDVRNHIYLATKTAAKTADEFWKDLETSLRLLKTDCIDVYQFHNPAVCPKPGDESGLYDAALKAREQGKIRFISITNHRLAVANEAVDSGLYATLQFPFCYLCSDADLALMEKCKKADMGFIAMKALSGGLINNSKAAYAFQAQYDSVLPIWGVQKESELDEFLSYIDNPPVMDDEIRTLIENVPASQKIPVPPPAHTGSPGEDDEDQRLSPLRPLHEQMPVWTEYTGVAAEKPEGL